MHVHTGGVLLLLLLHGVLLQGKYLSFKATLKKQKKQKKSNQILEKEVIFGQGSYTYRYEIYLEM